MWQVLISQSKEGIIALYEYDEIANVRLADVAIIIRFNFYA